uniref:Mating-type protein MAT-1 n=3 Tax=Neofusicoccum vitifusiforme TaxID=240343 RepID=A0A1J0A1F5_9PEZI|nr:mating type protein [Neofusicoccum vitifusiforme]APB08865.1 mating type protein [Neofusicoccum vitifusiforme]
MQAVSHAVHNQPAGPTQAQHLASTLSPPTPQQKNKKKRTLNCFVAFRCYASPIFDKYQQKNRSGFVRTLWEVEMTKAKWTILAKAYSNIRDEVGTENAPMDKFLNIACPHIGIVARDTYLHTFGWELISDESGSRLARRSVPDPASFPQGFLTTNVSTEDMIGFVRASGYGLPRNTPATIPGNASASSSNTGGSHLAMVAQPAHQVAQSAHQVAHPAHQAAQSAHQAAQSAHQVAQTGPQVVWTPPQQNTLVVHPPSQVAQGAPQVTQIVQPGPQNQNHPAVFPGQLPLPTFHTIQPANQAVQSAPPAQNKVSRGIAAYTHTDETEDELAHLRDPDPDSCVASRANFANPNLRGFSINAQLTNYSDLRPYFPQAPQANGSGTVNSSEGVSVGQSDQDNSTSGPEAFAELATDLWDTGSEYPHNDQFLPGQSYALLNDREDLPPFFSFDMNDEDFLQEYIHPDRFDNA